MQQNQHTPVSNLIMPTHSPLPAVEALSTLSVTALPVTASSLAQPLPLLSASVPEMAPTEAFIQHLQQGLLKQQLGLQSRDGFMPVPVSLTPWRLNASQFALVQQLAQTLGQLQARASQQLDWLLDATAELANSATIPGQIWRTLQSLRSAGSKVNQQLAVNAGLAAHQEASTTQQPATQPDRNVPLNRHDFILDTQQQWRWVESNPIAAGMGPLNERYLALLQQHLAVSDAGNTNKAGNTAASSNCTGSFADNPAIGQQARLLAEAATANATHAFTQKANNASLSGTAASGMALAGMAVSDIALNQHPLLLIVVDADEDNIFDQQLLCAAVQAHGVQVQRVTVAELLTAEFTAGHQLHWRGQRVDLLYWRTGYNPAAALDDTYWQFRRQLEQTLVSQCPTLAGQLVGSKWFQHQLTQQLLTAPALLAQQFDMPLSAIRQLSAAVLPSVAVSTLAMSAATALIEQGYWYKTQQEGGGNVARGTDALAKLKTADTADLLMAPIDAQIRPETLYSLRHGSPQHANAHITELGIFSVATKANYGGYLCRTKPANSHEGGVHRGTAVLDTVYLVGE